MRWLRGLFYALANLIATTIDDLSSAVDKMGLNAESSLIIKASSKCATNCMRVTFSSIVAMATLTE